MRTYNNNPYSKRKIVWTECTKCPIYIVSDGIQLCYFCVQEDGTWTDIPRCVEHEPGVDEQIPGLCPGISGYCSQEINQHEIPRKSAKWHTMKMRQHSAMMMIQGWIARYYLESWNSMETWLFVVSKGGWKVFLTLVLILDGNAKKNNLRVLPI